MFKIRFFLLSVLTTLLISGIATSVASASGPFWHVGGSKLTAGTKQAKMQLKGYAFLKSPSAGIEVECASGLSEGATIEGSKETQGQSKGQMSYATCRVIKPAAKEGAQCKVIEPIVTNPLKAYLANASTQTGIVEVFEPGQGTVLATLHFGVAKPCLGLKEAGVTGAVAGEVIPSGLERKEDLLAFPSTAITKVKHEGVEKTLKLETVGFAATLTGTNGSCVESETFGAFET